MAQTNTKVEDVTFTLSIGIYKKKSQYFISSKRQNIFRYKSLALGPHSVVQTPSVNLPRTYPSDCILLYSWRSLHTSLTFELGVSIDLLIPANLGTDTFFCWSSNLQRLISTLSKNTATTHFPIAWRLQAKQDRSPWLEREVGDHHSFPRLSRSSPICLLLPPS